MSPSLKRRTHSWTSCLGDTYSPFGLAKVLVLGPNNYSAPQRRRCTEYAIPAPRPPPRISPAYQWIGQTDRRRFALVPQSYLALSQVYPLRPRSAGRNGHSVIPCVRTSASTSFAPLARSGSKGPPSLARHAPAFRSPGHVRPASRAFSASIIFQPFPDGSRKLASTLP